ncbi:fatty acid desaturase family protein [Aestuariimicrobium soli]|uniref:fatty acid desaturase family protein n=1 Tax=Aestuariimicrobium soli TaxID=2035834 RepID=UPI003EBE3AF6
MTDGPLGQHADASSFPPQLRAFIEVSTQAKQSGLLNRTLWFYWTLLGVLALALGGCITGFILLGSSWLQLLIAAALGIVFTQVAFVGHEAGHRQIFASGRNNTRLARLLATGVVGLSLSWWDNKHARHHGNPNRVGKDPDIERDTISFLPEDARRATGWLRWLTRRQGWLFFPLLTLEGLNLHQHSVRHVFGRGRVEKRWTEMVLLTLRLAAVVVPVFLVLPLGLAFAFMGVQLAVFGVYMGASFAPNHKGMPVIAPEARLDFFTKQVRTSRNIRGGWWASLLMGGLNHQIEHHLFPNMPRPHLRRAREIVKQYCRTHDVPYTETSLLASYAIVVRHLNEVGLHARDPFDCPMNALRRA